MRFLLNHKVDSTTIHNQHIFFADDSLTTTRFKQFEVDLSPDPHLLGYHNKKTTVPCLACGHQIPVETLQVTIAPIDRAQIRWHGSEYSWLGIFLSVVRRTFILCLFVVVVASFFGLLLFSLKPVAQTSVGIMAQQNGFPIWALLSCFGMTIWFVYIACRLALSQRVLLVVRNARDLGSRHPDRYNLLLEASLVRDEAYSLHSVIVGGTTVAWFPVTQELGKELRKGDWLVGADTVRWLEL